MHDTSLSGWWGGPYVSRLPSSIMRIRHSLAVVLTSALAVTACGAGDTADAPASEPTTSAESASSPSSTQPSPSSSVQPAVCGDDLLASLSLRQKLAQLLNVGVTGATTRLR